MEHQETDRKTDRNGGSVRDMDRDRDLMRNMDRDRDRQETR